jgi:hypothetical protein
VAGLVGLPLHRRHKPRRRHQPDADPRRGRRCDAREPEAEPHPIGSKAQEGRQSDQQAVGIERGAGNDRGQPEPLQTDEAAGPQRDENGCGAETQGDDTGQVARQALAVQEGRQQGLRSPE